MLLAVGLTALIGAVGVVGHWARTGPYERDRLQQAEGARRHLREMQAQDAARIRKEIEQARAIEDAVQRDAARRQPAPRAMTLTRQPSEPLRR
ncbi:MAG: hypothetical protein H6708_08095 [Kofleriaceae bacterium]|nr:hypothetical protein [Kofleriaceae bacterium]